ncbi:MAG: YkgJ family cysteine cluster protein [Candidatus Omnitrophota bacterium]
MKKCRKITEEELFQICTTCVTGSCCQDGVDVDLEEAKKISQLNITLKKPWFNNLFRDADMPSGWAVSSVVRHGRCVFQKSNYKCMVYEHRPYFCREFPLEKGRIAELYGYLCEKPTHLKRKARKDLKHTLKPLPKV